MWLLPSGRLPPVLSALVALFALSVFVGLVRLESPLALGALVLALVTGAMFEGSFASVVADGDRLHASRGLLGVRSRHTISVANDCAVTVVTASDLAPGSGRNQAGALHLVEVKTPEGAWVLAEERDRAAAEAVADWLRQHVPADRLRLAAEPAPPVHPAPPADEPPAAEGRDGRSQADG